MINYVLELLDRRDDINIKKYNDKDIHLEKLNKKNEIKYIHIYSFGYKPSVNYFKEELIKDDLNGVLSVPIFYKNGIDYFVRYVNSHKKPQNNKCLEDGTKLNMHKLIDLRNLEDFVLRHTDDPFLAYYQPQTKRLPQSVRVFDMRTSDSDYEKSWEKYNEFELPPFRTNSRVKYPSEESRIIGSTIGFKPGRFRKLARISSYKSDKIDPETGMGKLFPDN
jgi:hypothetical protein